MYVNGLGLRIVGGFKDHDGFDGAMLQGDSKDFHLEFTHCSARPVLPSPTHEDLLVIYIPETASWADRCNAMLKAGFVEVQPGNPYWGQNGRTLRDPDGYLVVIHNGRWEAG
jgi:uncharacterized glyoxalase superfamily protein PhnB